MSRPYIGVCENITSAVEGSNEGKPKKNQKKRRGFFGSSEFRCLPSESGCGPQKRNSLLRSLLQQEEVQALSAQASTQTCAYGIGFGRPEAPREIVAGSNPPLGGQSRSGGEFVVSPIPYHEYIQGAKGGGDHNEEVARHDHLGMVMDKR